MYVGLEEVNEHRLQMKQFKDEKPHEGPSVEVPDGAYAATNGDDHREAWRESGDNQDNWEEKTSISQGVQILAMTKLP